MTTETTYLYAIDRAFEIGHKQGVLDGYLLAALEVTTTLAMGLFEAGDISLDKALAIIEAAISVVDSH